MYCFTSLQNFLLDQFGCLDEAVEWAAKEAGLEEGGWHRKFLGVESNQYDSLIRQLVTNSGSPATRAGDIFGLVAQQQSNLVTRLASDVDRLSGAHGVQAYCLECPVQPQADATAKQQGWLASLMLLLTR